MGGSWRIDRFVLNPPASTVAERCVWAARLACHRMWHIVRPCPTRRHPWSRRGSLGPTSANLDRIHRHRADAGKHWSTSTGLRRFPLLFGRIRLRYVGQWNCEIRRSSGHRCVQHPAGCGRRDTAQCAVSRGVAAIPHIVRWLRSRPFDPRIRACALWECAHCCGRASPLSAGRHSPAVQQGFCTVQGLPL